MIVRDGIDIYHGDCISLMRSFDEKSVDTVVTDIPYCEVNRCDNGLRNLSKGAADEFAYSLQTLTDELLRICCGSIYMFCGIGQVSTLRDLLIRGGAKHKIADMGKT